MQLIEVTGEFGDHALTGILADEFGAVGGVSEWGLRSNWHAVGGGPVLCYMYDVRGRELEHGTAIANDNNST